MKAYDWADKAAKAMQPNVRLFANNGEPADSVFVQWMSAKLRAAYRRGAKEEREACLSIAMLAEMFKPNADGTWIADAIRKRGKR
jgi:hypothetical protein